MHEPIIFVIDRDPDILKCIAGSLERRFGADYQVLTECSPTAALARLGEACGRGEQVALVIADIWTSEMSGLEWLERIGLRPPRCCGSSASAGRSAATRSATSWSAPESPTTFARTIRRWAGR